MFYLKLTQFNISQMGRKKLQEKNIPPSMYAYYGCFSQSEQVF